ncbi:MAG: S-layer homology domain-containing protein [Phascolarctobacterium sp.]
MKKTLLAAVALSLGITASAWAAANPFSDVPAGHWAYDSIAKLAAAGVVEGYGDTTFGGDKLMTRYEMAQIVARAMAKGAKVDKLAAEFASELDNLGVRVANLEKKSDNIRFWGMFRPRYEFSHLSGEKKDHRDAAIARTRIWGEGKINDSWTYNLMLQNEQIITNETGEENVDFKRAFVQGRLGGMTVRAGRWGEDISPMVIDTHLEGVKLSYGTDKLNVVSMFTKAAGPHSTLSSHGRLNIFGVAGNYDKGNFFVNYYNTNDAAVIAVDDGHGWFDKTASIGGDKDILNIGIGYKVTKDVRLFGEYMHSTKDIDPRIGRKGYVARIEYKGYDINKPGSFGLVANYYNQASNSFLVPTIAANRFLCDGGFEGWNVGARYTISKNVYALVDYFDTEAKLGNHRDKVMVSELYFLF